MVTDFERARLAGAHEDLLHDLLLEIAAYAKYHFLHEERLLARSGFSDLEGHRQKHGHFMDMIFNATLSWKLGLSGFAGAGNLLSNWLVDHIREEDGRYGVIGTDTGFLNHPDVPAYSAQQNQMKTREVVSA